MRDRIRRCLDGDRKAFGELIELFEGLIVSYAHGLSGDVHEAEEIAQETFVRAFRTLDRLKDPERFLGWLKGIGRNVARERARRRAEEPELLDLSSLQNLGTGTGKQGREDWLGGFSAGELYSKISAEIPRLAEPYQVVLSLRYYRKLSCREIARRLGVPVGTVTMRLSRAHRHLREVLLRQLQLSDGGTPE